MTLFTKKPKAPSDAAFLRSLTIDILREATDSRRILLETTSILRQISNLLQSEAALRAEYMQMKVSIAKQVLTPHTPPAKLPNDDRY
jgi:hypothetical protein